MAGRKAKHRDKLKKVDLINLKPLDIICPICRTVLIEPVTLPCNHVFCKLCFVGAMENANLVCPLCRIRVSSWYRKAKKDGTLVDDNLWNALKTQYPTEVQNRYEGIDNAIEEEQPKIIVATPGEIRKEYEFQMKKQEEELQKIHDEEEKASTAYISKLKAEEEQERKIINEKLRLDEELARKLAEELNPSTSKLANNLMKKRSGRLDRFIKNQTIKTVKSTPKSERPTSLNKTNLLSEDIKSVSPNNLPTKAYTCQILYIDTNNMGSGSYENIRNSVDQKKLKRGGQISNVNLIERKICQSECRSNGSGDDVIDQECKFYFKPIDIQKKYHIQGHVPLKVHCKRSITISQPQIIPPAGKIIRIPSNVSAFANIRLNSSTASIVQQESTLASFKKLDEMTLGKINRGRNPKHESNILSEKKSPDFYGFNKSDVSESTANCDSILKLISNLNKGISLVPTKSPSFDQVSITCAINKSNSVSSNTDVQNIKLINGFHSVTDRQYKTNQFYNTSSILKPENEYPTTGKYSATSAQKNYTVTTLKDIRSPRKNNAIDEVNVNLNVEEKQNTNKQTYLCMQNKNIHTPISVQDAHVKKNNYVTLKSPKKIKVSNSNVPNNITSVPLINITIEQKKIQEESDFQLAKKLQAEFDLIQVPSRTRRGTKRQITLDEMLLV